jgi:regulator of protease activity HflC (stomatin/prohibitin superfamily)
MWLFLIILGIILILTGIMGYRKGWFRGFGNPRAIKKSGVIIGIFFSILGVLLTSFHYTPTKHVGHLTLKYGVGLDGDRVIAINGERGRQDWVLQEGLNIKPFINVFYDIENVPYVKIEEGKTGLLTAVDGYSLDNGLFIAPDWVPTNMENKRDSIERAMLDPKTFIESGGKKGPQLNVLKPGEYKINTYMWNVDIVDAYRVPDGNVGVVISRVGRVPENIELENFGNQLATPVVDEGYMGVWKKTLPPGMYYLNVHPDTKKGAYELKIVDTRVQTWIYKGDYSWYTIDLTISEDGKIVQNKSNDKFDEKPQDAADGAIQVISKDGWDVFIDGRILVQVQPSDAPYIIASVGGLNELQNKVTTPLIRSVLRNIAETREAPTFVWERSKIEKETDSLLKKKSDGSRLTIKEFKMNNVYIKPELLVPDKRKQLAKKMENTYKQEQLAYSEKVKTEKAREEAAQQGELVKAKIAKQAAAEYKEAEYLKGQGTKLRMIEEATGQQALMNVLGADRAYGLQMVERLDDLPSEAWQTPLFYSAGGGAASDAYTGITINNMVETMSKIGTGSTPIDPAIVNEAVKKYNENNKKTVERKQEVVKEDPATKIMSVVKQ